MKDKKQENWVKEQLELNGEISRNECIRNFISRLSAIIQDLEEQGYEFDAFYRSTQNGRDFVYTLIKKP